MTTVKPRSASWSDEIDSIIERRTAEESMNRSQYLRKCIREEAERAHAMRVQRMLASFLPQDLHALAVSSATVKA